MVQSIRRAFAVLEAVAERPIALTPLAARLELPKSTVSRLLATLEGLGAVERVEGPRWRIGPAIAALGSDLAPAQRLTVLARPQLHELVRALDEDAGLALADGYVVRYVDQVESGHPVQVRDWTGTEAPMHAVPSGLVFLAAWPEEAVAGYVAEGLERLTEHTIADPRLLRHRLAEVRASGFAWGLEEYAKGINSVAAPVADERGHVVAAIHVHGPAYRFPPAGDEERIARRVVEAAETVRSQLPSST